MTPAAKNRGSQIITSERPSSFPGIWKYPTFTQHHFQSALDWMNGKRKDDDLNGLWRVHDKIYDLQTFVKHHPGGSDWLEMSRGTDITEAFEVSHVANPGLVEKTLKSYYVSEATSQRLSPYTFKEDGFFNILKERIEPIIKVIGTGPTNEIKWMMDSIVVVFLLMTILATRMNSICLQILTGLILAMTLIAAHNFLHLRENWRKFYFDLGWLSSYEFRLSHAFSHHLYANTVMDLEIATVEPMLEFFPKRNKLWIQRYGPYIYNPLVYATNFLIPFLMRWKGILSGKVNFRPENVLVLLHLLLCILIGPNWIASLGSWFVIHLASSYFLILCGINAAHHHPAIFHDGDEARGDPDFGLCQLDAVRDRSDGWIRNSLFVQLVVFGEHSLHHLFPTICASKLGYLKTALEETLEEFEEEFPALSQWEHFKGCFAQLRRTERTGVEERKLKSKRFSNQKFK